MSLCITTPIFEHDYIQSLIITIRLYVRRKKQFDILSILTLVTAQCLHASKKEFFFSFEKIQIRDVHVY